MKKIHFVVIGAMLVIGLMSTIYFVKQRGDIARKDQAIAAYDKQQADQKKTETASNSKVETPGDNSESNQEVAGSAAELPVTGPEFVIGEMLGAGLLTAAIISYVLSRRDLVRYL